MTMRIGIIGSGHIGGTLAKLFGRAGHEVVISNSRAPASLTALVADIGSQARAAAPAEAAAFGEVVVLAIPYGKYQTLPAAQLKGKVVIDAMNYYSQRDGEIDFGDLTSTELVARHAPDGRFVKAFNTMYFETLASKGNPALSLQGRLAIFVSGDDPGAKAVVEQLIREIGFAPVDLGSLRDGRSQQPGASIYNRPLTLTEARKLLEIA
jgi:8-hydroxy-5-deazaflavin:NADPH oxidoreductase